MNEGENISLSLTQPGKIVLKVKLMLKDGDFIVFLPCFPVNRL